MILQIDENYRIKSDQYNFILERKRASKNSNKERWSPVSHHPDIEGVLKSVRDEKLRNLDVHILDELDHHLHALTQDLRAIGERCVDVWGKE